MRQFLNYSCLALAVSLSSLTMKSKKFTGTWYMYTVGGVQNVVLRETPSSYTRISFDPECFGSTNQCAVEMRVNNGTSPNFAMAGFDLNGYPIVDGMTVLASEKLEE